MQGVDLSSEDSDAPKDVQDKISENTDDDTITLSIVSLIHMIWGRSP